MSALTCAFPDKIRFYHQVLKDGQGNLFVPTNEEVRPGTDIDVEISIGGDAEPLKTRARVVAQRTQRGAANLGEAGVWVRIAPEELDAVGARLRAEDGGLENATFRQYPRFRHSLRVWVDKPVQRSVRAINVSQGGVRLAGLLPVPVGQTIHMAIDFGTRSTESLPIYGRIAWKREDKNETGVEFRFQNDSVRERITYFIRKIADEDDEVVFAQQSLLVVDDDLTALRTITRLLGARGYGTVAATSGPEALAIARESSPSLILLDVMLPGMNGLEVCRIIKRDAETSRIPVVLMSGADESQLAMLIDEAGALTGLTKPYRVETLQMLVEHILAFNQMLSPASESPEENRRSHDRSPLFLRCYYESDALHAETFLRDASPGGGFLNCYWGEPPGTRAKVTLLDHLEVPLELDVEVVRRTDWGVIHGDWPMQIPGLGLRFIENAQLTQFTHWLAHYEESLSNKPIILVVDDDRIHLEILTTTLQHAGFAVVALDSPAGVSHAVALAKPALVILDFMMPGLDGSQLCKMLKADKRTASTPVWIYSSLSPERLEELARESSADGYIQKGIRLAALIERVKAAVPAKPQP